MRVTTDATDKSAPSWAPSSDALVFAVTGQGIYSSTQGVGGTWGAPVQLHSGATDATPDWQTTAPQKVAPPSITGGVAPQTASFCRQRTEPGSGPTAVGLRIPVAALRLGGEQLRRHRRRNRFDVRRRVRGYRKHISRRGHGGRTSPAPTASDPSAATGIVTLAGTVNPPVNTSYPVIIAPVHEHDGARTSATSCRCPTGRGRGRSRSPSRISGRSAPRRRDRASPSSARRTAPSRSRATCTGCRSGPR